MNATSGSGDVRAAIMYAPDFELCVMAKEKMKEESAHNGTLELFLQKCLDKKSLGSCLMSVSLCRIFY